MNAAQIQAALDALPASGGLVQLPPGASTIETPLRIRTHKARLYGDPDGTTYLHNTKSGGQPLVVIAPTLTPQPVLFHSNPGGPATCW